jgi:hypothetical protein
MVSEKPASDHLFLYTGIGMDGAKLKELLNDADFMKRLMMHRGQTRGMQKTFRAHGLEVSMVEAEQIDKMISKDLPEGADATAYAKAAAKAIPDIEKAFKL